MVITSNTALVRYWRALLSLSVDKNEPERQVISFFSCLKANRQCHLTQTTVTMMNTSRNTTLPRKKKEDEEAAASFLLSLRRDSDRSATVSPEPLVPQPMPSAPGNGVIHQGFMGKLEAYRPNLKSATLDVPQCNVDFCQLVKGSSLVQIKDRDLVPDGLFVAMAQMQPCELNHADRVGCYKSREIGFVGMSCKFCGGQPGFGRFFPASIRSLAQTTTSQTVLKHVSTKCRFVPNHVRNAVLDLQQLQAAQEGMASGRPRYGSRKIFFQRVWSRLHGGGDEKQATIPSAKSTPVGKPAVNKPRSTSELPLQPDNSLMSKRKVSATVMPPMNKRAKTEILPGTAAPSSGYCEI